MKFESKEELLEYTSNIKGKTFKQIDSENLLKNTTLKKQKGILGQVVEKGFYKYPLNSNSIADFEELGIELKVSGYIKNKNGGIRAKERLVLSKINYNDIIHETYERSHLLGKCKEMLIIWYHYNSKKPIEEFEITNYQLYDMSKDENIFKNDFEIIKNKVMDGKAHELSEGDTSYLGACTKAAKSTDRTTQPFSPIKAKPRAFSLKNSYMNGILQESLHPKIIEIKSNPIKSKPTQLMRHNKRTYNQSEIDEIISELENKINSKYEENKIMTNEIDYNNLISNEPEFKTIQEYIQYKLTPYICKTQIEIMNELTGKTYEDKIPKNINKLISDILIGKDNELKKMELFNKTNYMIKNLPVNGFNPLERMSFKTVSISDFDEDWEDSYWKNYFEEITLITICYEGKSGSKNGYRRLKYVRNITFDDFDLDSFKKTYDMFKLAIEKEDISLLPRPNSFENQLLEIAPKGKKGDDAYNNFFKNDKTKVSFMLSKEILRKKLNK